MKGKNQDIWDIVGFVTTNDSDLLGHSDSDQEPEAFINPQEQENSI